MMETKPNLCAFPRKILVSNGSEVNIKINSGFRKKGCQTFAEVLGSDYSGNSNQMKNTGTFKSTYFRVQNKKEKISSRFF